MANYPRLGRGYTYPARGGKRRTWNLPRWMGMAIVLIIAALIFSRPTRSQLQQSGGVANVTVTGSLPAGSNLIGKVGIDQTTPGTTNLVSIGTNGTVAIGAGSAVIGHVIADSGSTTAVTSLPSLTTGSNVIGTVNTIPKTACGNTVASQALAAVPTSSTAVFSSTTCLSVIILNNTNSSSITVTVTDNAGSPINDVLTFSIPANSQLIQPLWGVAFTTGMKWSASTTGVTGAALGYQ